MARKIKGGQHQADRPKPQYQGLAQPIGTQTNGQAGKGRVTETSGQSFNGSEPFNEPATGSIIGAVGKGKPQIPWAIFADERLGPTALGILCYVFAKPPGWDISVKELRQRFGGHERLICQGLKQAQQAGWTAFTQLRSMDGRRAYGTKWFARRSLDERWPETFMTRDCNSLKLRFLSLREPRSINDTDRKNYLRARERAKSARDPSRPALRATVLLLWGTVIRIRPSQSQKPPTKRASRKTFKATGAAGLCEPTPSGRSFTPGAAVSATVAANLADRTRKVSGPGCPVRSSIGVTRSRSLTKSLATIWAANSIPRRKRTIWRRRIRRCYRSLSKRPKNAANRM
jgi:hypothetical protein